MKRVCRPMSPKELEVLAALWPTSLSDKALAAAFRRQRSVIRRVATETLGLPCRTTARAQASERYRKLIAELAEERRAFDAMAEAA